jgi:hypothetical protein
MPLATAELVVRDWLTTAFPTARVVTETPANLEQELPCIQVVRFGGADPLLVLDVANIDIDTYAASRDASRILAEQVRTSLRLHAEGQSVDGAFIAAVTTITAPRWVPYDNTNLRRFTAAYQVAIRSIP